jgi:hypothetical protein
LDFRDFLDRWLAGIARAQADRPHWIGVGYQWTLTDEHPQYQHNWILSVRKLF